VPDVILKIWLSLAERTTFPAGEIAQSPNSTFALMRNEREKIFQANGFQKTHVTLPKNPARNFIS
jgi:hypothetical protein